MPIKKCEIVHTVSYELAKFWRDRVRCSEIEVITIPFYNFSKSIKYSWFVSLPTLVPVKNAKLLTPLFREDS